MKYAEKTDVPVERSKAEIEATVMKYGATGFISGWRGTEASIAFEMNARRIRFTLPLPDINDQEFQRARINQHSTNTKQRPPDQVRKAWEQACRQKFRALSLVIKAKLEAIESEISTFDQEFMANIVMANGMTIGEEFLPQLPNIIEKSKLPPLLT